MRWNKRPPKRLPQMGDRRQRAGFLLFWKKDTETETYRWLEFAEWEEMYTYILYPGDDVYGWHCLKWLNK